MSNVEDLGFELDDEFRNLFSAPSAVQDEFFDQTVEGAAGALHKLWVWDEGNILIDGYRRLARCLEHGLAYEVERLSFPSRDEARFFVIRDQLSRRNLTEHEIAVFTVQLAERYGNKAAAEMTNQSVRNVRRSKAVVNALAKLGGDWDSIARTHHRKVRKSDFIYLAEHGAQEDWDKLAEELIRTDKGECLKEWVNIHKAAASTAKTEKAAKQTELREEKKEERQEEYEAKGGEQVDPSPTVVPEKFEKTVPVPPPAETTGPTREEVDKALATIAKLGGKYMAEVYRLFDACGELKGHRHARVTGGYRDIVKTLDEMEDLYGNKAGAQRRASYS